MSSSWPRWRRPCHKNCVDETLSFEPKIIAFLCTWCSYAGADLAGISRLQYPPSIRIIKVPCSGRISANLILAAIRSGADGVLVSGCHPGDCHYQSGNYHARRRFVLLKKLLEFVGLESDRLHFTWISASEGEQFAAVVREVTDRVRGLGPATRFVKHLPDGSGE
ncbi:hydrogenase iron-sulfur subunit [Desulfolithobacter sp.]